MKFYGPEMIPKLPIKYYSKQEGEDLCFYEKETDFYLGVITPCHEESKDFFVYVSIEGMENYQGHGIDKHYAESILIETWQMYLEERSK